MSRKLIIDGNAVYEIDEKCMLKKKLGELKEKKITSDEKRAEQSVVTGKPNRLKDKPEGACGFSACPI